MYTVHFADDELDVEVEPDSNLRDVAQTEGASIPFGCEQGICGTCLISVDEEGNLSDIEETERDTLNAMGAEPGQRLACQCQAEGDLTVTSAF